MPALLKLTLRSIMNSIFTLKQPLKSIMWPAENRLFREILLVILGIAFLGLSAQIVIPLQPVPLTFQSAAVIFLSMVYGSRLGSYTLLGYLGAGVIGLPVFADMSFGMHVLIGPTAGYLVGFVIAAFVGGMLAQRGWARHSMSAFIAAILSASIIFTCGVSVLSLFVGFQQAIVLGLLPFIMTEVMKLFAVALVVPRFWKKM
jgi:biotin transport system substrate-specific component